MMEHAFYVGATGLVAQEKAIESVSNNIVNINTPAYKRSTVSFSTLVAPARPDEPHPNDAIEPTPVPTPLGVAVAPARIDLTAGQISSTGQPLDIAIHGAGFIELASNTGQTVLWRGGTLTVNSDGLLSAPNGTPLKAGITAPADMSSLTISADGKVQTAKTAGAPPVTLGQIQLVQVKAPDVLEAQSGGYYVVAETSDISASTPGQDGAGVLTQGSLEQSNTNLATEMVALLMMQRAYSASAQVVSAADQLNAIIDDLRRA
jgi:flagellar basal-body rod protein FlgG